MDLITRKARQEGRRTCQCCGRLIMANLGTIAHHGYQRPQGWACQVGTCRGSKHVPFEVSRDVLGLLLDNIRAQLANATKYLADVQDEVVPVPFRYTRRQGFGLKSADHHVDVTRESFDDVRAAYESEMRKHSVHTFDDIQAGEVRRMEHRVKQIQAVLSEQQARYDGWVQTEIWDAQDAIWVPYYPAPAEGGAL